MILTRPQPALVSWLCERIKLVPTKNIVCLGNWSPTKKRLVGVVGLDGWNDASVEMHCAGEGLWISRELLFKAFHYPFVQAGVNCVLGRVSSTNTAALRLNKHLGFRELCRIPDAMDDGDMVVMAMYKDDCRWLDILPHRQKEVA